MATEKTIKIAGQSYKIDTGTVDNVYKQIAAQGLMSQWKGEGFGSAEQNARRMAEELVASGVTDIKDIGMIEITSDAEVQPVFDAVLSDDGQEYISKIIGYTPSNRIN